MELLIFILAGLSLILGIVKLIDREILIGVVLVVVGLILAAYSGGLW